MKELYVSGTSQTIWDELDNKFNEVNTEKNCVEITLSISDGKNVGSLKRLDSFFNALEHDNVTFVLVYNLCLTDNKEIGWLGFANKMRKKMLEQVKNIRGVVNSIVKVVFNFDVSTVDYNNYKVLESIKNLSPETRGYFEVNLRIKSCLHQIDIPVLSNDRNGWIAAYELLKTIICLTGNNSADGIKLPLNFTIYIDDNNDATNLRYFLPLWHHYNEKYEVKLVVENDANFKSRQFLSLLKNDLARTVILNGYQLGKKKDISVSDILPFLKINSDPEIDETLNDLLYSYFQYIANYENYVGDKEAKLSAADKKAGRDKLIMTLFDINGDFINYGDKKFLEEVVRRLGKENQEQPLTDLEDVISKQTNKFTSLIFLFQIRNFIENNALLLLEKKDSGDTVNISLLESIWFNSKTYAEGLLQIIENAQLHSEGHIAFFGMRVYNADPSVPMGELSKAANTRHMLWRKYWYDDGKIRNEIRDKKAINSKNKLSIFNCGRDDGYERFSNFLEFYVLDDAIDTAGNALGIVNKINGSKALKYKIGSIEKIFELTENDYNTEDDNNDKIDEKYGLPYMLMFYIQHYGMRWFKQHVNNLNGIMEIYSPYNDESLKVSDKVRVYSNIFENLEEVAKDGKMDLGNLFSTEYSVLIPLKYKQ